MKKNLLVTTLLLIFIINLIPITSNASTEVNHNNVISIPALKSPDTNITWNLSSKVAKTRSISCSKDNTLTLTCTLSSSTAKAEIGIIEPDGTYYTTIIKGFGTFTHEIPSTGTYKIYCKNLGTSDIAVSLTFLLN